MDETDRNQSTVGGGMRSEDKCREGGNQEKSHNANLAEDESSSVPTVVRLQRNLFR